MLILFWDRHGLNKLCFAANASPNNALYIRLTQSDITDSNIFDIMMNTSNLAEILSITAGKSQINIIS